ncbi:hypothetical protein BJX63DRAFT_311385 [Aspergillus granulosus]|uniref:Pentatricopeptide repeat-containing protein-mitochondrial domain-containing protein n=1 Tax=Aspergillus granulosus TaxID=176169 RepID=A0ABR4HZ34_9EURO
MMSHKRLVLDELWHCLCPSFTSNTLKRSRIPLLAKTRSRCPTSVLPIPSSLPKRYSSNSAQPQDASGKNGERPVSSDKSLDIPFKNEPSIPPRNVDRPKSHRNKQARGGYIVPIHLHSLTTQEIEAKLQDLAKNFPNVHSAMQKLQHLIQDRRIRPSARHYKWLIQCNSDPQHGSPVLIRQLLLEMERNNIPLDSGTLHAALQALAVHPDYTLRQDVLRAMRDRWLPLSTDGWHHVVAGLIREHQFELALDHIAHMERKDIIVKDWLHSLLIYYLCECQEFGQILELLRTRLEQGFSITQELWIHILNAATVARHVKTIRFVWKRVVDLGALHPDILLCNRILEIATENGDTRLGRSVLLFLLNSGVPLEPRHYEKLCHMHVISDDLQASLRVLCEMNGAGHTVQSGSVEPILNHCIANKIRPRDVWAHLKDLRSKGLKIPLACARIVIDLYREGARSDPFEVDDGVAFYKELYTLCPGQLDPATFNALIRMCRVTKDAESAMFILHEMAGSQVMPDATTFAHLIMLCMECGNFKSAELYFEDLLERGLHLGQAAREEIRDLCNSSANTAAVKLREHPEISEDAPEENVATLETVEHTTSPIGETKHKHHLDPKHVRRQYNKK